MPWTTCTQLPPLSLSQSHLRNLNSPSCHLNMADIPTNSQPRPRRRADPSKLSADPRPTVAFGFVLNHQCRLRWARYFVAEHAKEKPGAYTPEQIEDMLDSIVRAMNRAIPEHVYAALPDLPRIRWNLLPVRDGKPVSYNLWVFALRDNSTSWRKRSPMTPEDIEAVRKALRLEEGEQPKWVRIAGYVGESFCMITPSLIPARCTRI